MEQEAKWFTAGATESEVTAQNITYNCKNEWKENNFQESPPQKKVLPIIFHSSNTLKGKQLHSTIL